MKVITSITQMKRVILLVALLGITTGWMTAESVYAQQYRIISEKDISYRTRKRLAVDVVVPRSLRDEQIRVIIQQIVRTRSTRWTDVSVLAFLEGTNTSGLAYARGEWAPAGKWGNLSSQTHALNFKIISPGHRGVPEKLHEKERHIFKELERCERSMSVDVCYAQISRKYGITEKVLNNISGKGVLAGW